MNKYLREPVNGITHMIGAVFSVFALIAMIIKVKTNNSDPIVYLSVLLFGIGMILLYSASATYHSIISNEKVIKILKKLDHSMIFILIAGSYAPFCLVALRNTIGYTLFSVVAICSLVGIAFKIAWVTCPRWLSSTIYIIMGWIIIFAIYPISQSLHLAGLILLILGGVLYTVGGVIYALKKDKFKIGVFGTHEIFHIFIMLGTLCHFIVVFNYVI